MVTTLCPKVQFFFQKSLKRALGGTFSHEDVVHVMFLLLNRYKFSKACKFVFILKNDHNNFKSHKIMLTTLWFTILYYKLHTTFFYRFHPIDMWSGLLEF
jgi:hypothetical protein